jgi:multiple sugar transport system permease protein|tara:strand:+ start:7654 stop:8550 length:897 start_codon:yes stop_codon:yes gene_type:complete
MTKILNFFNIGRVGNYPLYMVLPAVIVLLLLTIYPFIYLVYVSLYIWPISPTLPRIFLGFGQFTYLFSNPAFIESMQVTINLMVVGVTIQISLGMLLAILLSTKSRITNYFTLPFMVPVFVSPVVVGLIWKFMFNYDLGILNYLLNVIGLESVNWLGTTTTAFWSVVIIDTWQWTPFTTLIIKAGLDSMDPTPQEAATVDGASRFQIFTLVTFPSIAPIFAVALLFRTLDAFKAFDIIYIVTRGGPGGSTYVLGYNIWKTAFYQNQLGLAAAMSVVMIIIATILAFILVRIMKGLMER